jgi:hypothetical protein
MCPHAGELDSGTIAEYVVANRSGTLAKQPAAE